jgi:D-sedoheptulose 7-phosphate isomerase
MEDAVFGDKNDAVLGHMQESICVLQEFLNNKGLHADLKVVCDLCVSVYRNEKKILVAGNGGSAADAQHFAGELVSRFYFDRPPLSAIALTTDTSILTAIGNDYGYKEIFARQILANGCAGDLFIAISTSGNSENILEAINACRKKDMFIVGLTGASGGMMRDLCDHCLCVPSSSTPRIQECHLVLEHTICAYVEQQIFGAGH